MGVLQQYKVNWVNVAGFTGDTCSINKALSRQQKKPAIGCYNHRLHLAVTDVLGQARYAEVVDLVSDYMNCLSQLKNGEVLRQYTKLLARKTYKNRWSGINTTFKRLIKLHPVVDEHKEEFTTELRELHDRIDDKMPVVNEVLEALVDFDEVAKHLQLRETTLAEARGFFDNLHDKYGTETFIPDLAIRTKFSDHLKKVWSADFENAIIKVQTGAEGTLTGDEAKTISMFLKSELLPAFAPVAGAASSLTKSVVAEVALKKARPDASRYINLDWIPPSSCEIERLFSQAKLIHTDHRRSILPCNLEIVLFLKMNSHRWDAMSVQRVMTTFQKGHYKYADNVLGYHGHNNFHEDTEEEEAGVTVTENEVMEIESESEENDV